MKHDYDCVTNQNNPYACSCGAFDADPVYSPTHYKWLPVEAIEITELFSFRVGNCLKYLLRHEHKGSPLQDLKKARWYLDREIAFREQQLEN